MEDIQESSNRVARCLPDFGLLNKGVVEERDGVLLFLVRAAPSVPTLGLLPRRRPGDVEPYLCHLIPPGRRLPALPWCRAVLAVRLSALADRELDGNFVAPGKIGVGDLRVWDFEGGSVLHVERELGLAKLGLAPVPAAQRVFLAFEVGAVPALEDFAEAFIVLCQVSPRAVMSRPRPSARLRTSCWKPSS
jgi:hypothetical protein